jgi:hypothetical protein
MKLQKNQKLIVLLRKNKNKQTRIGHYSILIIIKDLKKNKTHCSIQMFIRNAPGVVKEIYDKDQP